MMSTRPFYSVLRSDAIIVHNDGPRIAHSNHWSSALAAKGLLYISINAGVCRVLLPAGRLELVMAARTSREVLVTRASDIANGWRLLRKRQAEGCLRLPQSFV
jgi:hypothetical protein